MLRSPAAATRPTASRTRRSSSPHPNGRARHSWARRPFPEFS
jgi:hypothetical protein